MPKLLSEEAVRGYERDGFAFPIRVMSRDEAATYRGKLETYETATGGPIAKDKRHKLNVLFTWANELVRHPQILDAVEDVIGPNIICWTTNFFIKEANDPAFVSWHQDSTYWGLDPADVVTAWLALTDAPLETGPMKFWPGSHKMDQIAHVDTFDQHNILTRGQEVAVDVPEDQGVYAQMQAGEISLHHIRVVHGSAPNRTGNRRIGLAIRYIPTYVRQTHGPETAMLVRGVDAYGYFDPEPEPKADLDEAALAAHAAAAARQQAYLYKGTDKTEFRA